MPWIAAMVFTLRPCSTIAVESLTTELAQKAVLFADTPLTFGKHRFTLSTTNDPLATQE